MLNREETRGPGHTNENVATILVVEDETALRELVRHSLQKRNYGVIEAKNGDEGVEVFRKHSKKIQLVISDLAMPGMDGLECRNRILAMEPHVRFLFISGFPDRIVDRHNELLEGCEFLAKPFRLEQLTEKVSRMLSKDAAA